MRRTYTNFEDIEKDLKRLKLERQIAWEEMKLLKNEFKEDLSPANWVQTMLSAFGKYGMFILLKKLFKK